MPTISSSSEPAPAAMSAPSARRSSASRSPWSRSARPTAAPASTSAASRRRRCCTPPSCSRRRSATSARWASSVSAPKLDLKTMMAFKDEGVEGNVKGVEFLLKKNKIDAFHGSARIAAAGQVEVKGEDGSNQVVETKNIVIATGSDVDPPARHRDRREGGRLLDRRARARQGAEEAPRHRRRRDRARARLGLAPARRGGASSSSSSTASCPAWTSRSGGSSSASWRSRACSSGCPRR